MGIWLCVDKREIVVHLLRRIGRECGGTDDQQYGGMGKRGGRWCHIVIWQGTSRRNCDAVEFFSAVVLGLQNQIGAMIFN